MIGCVYKTQNGGCSKPGRDIAFCIGSSCQYQTPNNYNLFISKTLEELAEYLYNHDFCISPIQSDMQNTCEGECGACIKNWLNSPVRKEI